MPSSTFFPARHKALATAGGTLFLGLIGLLIAEVSPVQKRFAIAPFQADVTLPLGHPCMGGGISPAKQILDPLLVKGFVLLGPEKPFVVAVFDWCEIRNTSYDKWQRTLAEAAGTVPSHVLVTSTHVHDAPVMDEDAEELLRDMEASGAWKDIPPPDSKAAIQTASVCQPAFNEECLPRVAKAVQTALQTPIYLTHFGVGQARVREVASNRRYLKPDGGVSYNRMSRCSDPIAVAAEEGAIDPWLRTLTFWNGERVVCALHSYAVHPMSRYGSGQVSWDFVGQAREEMQRAHPEALQIYASGCAGNVTAGKYNTGSPDNRGVLAGKVRQAMEEAWKATVKHPFEQVDFRSALMPLGARNTPGFTETAVRHRLETGQRPFERSEASMGLAWYQRVQQGHRIEVPVLDFGPAKVMLLPAESYVEFQLYAESLRPEDFVMVMGYGECGPGYIPIERAWHEHDNNLHDWAWTPPGSEEVMKAAIRAALNR